MRAKIERIRADLEQTAQFTEGPGPGIVRLTYSAAEMKARRYLTNQMEHAGLRVREDEVGNVIGLLDGTDPTLPIIMIGSHMDSIRNGGNFDGMAGIIAGIEVARIINERKIPLRRSIEIVGITGEENSRFFPGVIGSRAMNGELTREELYTTRDPNGILLADAMKECSYDPDMVEQAARAPGSIDLFMELHIEQSRVLEATDTDVGIVTSICGSAHQQISINGRADHAGGTPMEMRKDAMLSAAELALEAERLAKEAGKDTVATFGKVEVFPNIPNVIPDRVDIVADIRSASNKCTLFVMDGLEAELKEICKRRRCTFSSHKELHGPPTIVPDRMIAMLSEKADALGISNRKIYSGAGHDAVLMNKLCPVAMLFVPSRDGRSHCPEEWTDYEYIQKGTEVLLEAVIELAQ